MEITLEMIRNFSTTDLTIFRLREIVIFFYCIIQVGNFHEIDVLLLDEYQIKK